MSKKLAYIGGGCLLIGLLGIPIEMHFNKYLGGSIEIIFALLSCYFIFKYDEQRKNNSLFKSNGETD